MDREREGEKGGIAEGAGERDREGWWEGEWEVFSPE